MFALARAYAVLGLLVSVPYCSVPFAPFRFVLFRFVPFDSDCSVPFRSVRTEFLTSSPDGHGLGVCGFVTTLCTSFFGSRAVVSQQNLKESTDKKGSREGL